MKAPRIMIAAPGSGSGKTMITCALLKALTDRGMKTAAFKCGPDFIDPMFHRNVLEVPSKNLDTYFTGEETTRQLFCQAGEGADISVTEGVMGLYDGLAGIKEEASSYHLAQVLDSPVILVVNSHGCGRSLLALIAGFLAYDKNKLIKGVILNRVSKSFYLLISREIEENLPVKVLGYFPYMDDMKVESRHLGLKLPHEVEQLKAKIEKASRILEETIDLDGLLQIADGAGEIVPEENTSGESFSWEEGKQNRSGSFPTDFSVSLKPEVKIGIAMDEAFCFYYEDNIRLFQQMGALLVPFSPLYDSRLPEGLGGLWLGGGYPELYAERLSKNQSMRNSIGDGLKEGLPSIAECGGFLYLHEEMKLKDGRVFPMVGAVRAGCFDTGRSVRFGYMELREKQPLFLEPGETIRGHEFHYFDSSDSGTDCIAEKPVSGRSWECVHETEKSWWGFAHLYYHSNPRFVRSFLEKAGIGT